MQCNQSSTLSRPTCHRRPLYTSVSCSGGCGEASVLGGSALLVLPGPHVSCRSIQPGLDVGGVILFDHFRNTGMAVLGDLIRCRPATCLARSAVNVPAALQSYLVVVLPGVRSFACSHSWESNQSSWLLSTGSRKALARRKEKVVNTTGY
jgi:hypothetical protein